MAGLRRDRVDGASRQAVNGLPFPAPPLPLGGEHLAHLHEPFHLLVDAVPAHSSSGLVASDTFTVGLPSSLWMPSFQDSSTSPVTKAATVPGTSR